MASRFVVGLEEAFGALNKTVKGLAAYEGKPAEITVLALGAVNLLIAIGYAVISIAYDLRYLADAKFAEDRREGFVGAKGSPAPDPSEGA